MSKKLMYFAKVITVEPAYFLYWAVYIIIDITNTTLLLEKKCRIGLTSEPDLNTECPDEKLGIRYANEMNAFYRPIMLIFCTLCSVLVASWSDSAGKRRRPLIFLPIIGQIFQAMFGCLNSYFWTWTPLAAMLSNIATEMMSGGIAVMILGTQMYIGDVSSTKNRTMRMGLLLATRTLADFVGYGGSGFLLHSLGFFYTYLTCFVLSISSLIMALIFIKDTSVPTQEKYGFGRIFNVVKIFEGFSTVFKKGLGKKRIVVLILLMIYTTVSFSTQGEKGVLYLYLRNTFHWKEREYSSYVLYRYTGVIIGSVFCSVVLSKHLQLHDGLIGAFAGIFDTIAALGYLFADKNWHLYIVPLFDVFHGTAVSVSLSFLSKFYESAELGRLSSVLGMFSLVIPACHPVYNGIFDATMDIFPSTFFLLSVSLDTIIVLLYFTTYLLTRSLHEKTERTRMEEEKEARLMLN